MSQLRDVPAALRPKRMKWFMAFVWIALASVLAYGVSRWLWGWSPGEWGGLVFGTLAALLMIFEVAYALRRRLLVGPLKTGQNWLQAHVYGGALAGVFVLLHTGFQWPHGSFGWLLFGLTLLTVGSGILGVIGQKIVPSTLSAVGVEAIYETIPDLVAGLRTQAREVVTGASDRLQRFYGTQVQPALAGPSVAWAYLVDVKSDRDRRLAEFESLRSFVDDADRQRLEQLQTLLVRKIDLEAHYTWQTVLRWWLLLHVPAAMILMALVIGHVAAVLRY